MTLFILLKYIIYILKNNLLLLIYKTFLGAVMTELAIAVIAQVLGQLAAMAVGATIGAIIDSSASLTMPWYSNIWLIFPLFWLPCASVYALVPNLINCWRSEKVYIIIIFFSISIFKFKLLC